MTSIGVEDSDLMIKALKRDLSFRFISAKECQKFSSLAQLITARTSSAKLAATRPLLPLPSVSEWKNLILKGAELRTIKKGEAIIRTGPAPSLTR